MSSETYIGIFSINDENFTVVKKDGKYFGGSVCNVGFLPHTDPHDTVGEVYEELINKGEN